MKKRLFRRITDVGMTVLLLCLMAYQVTGEVLHEWIGIGMTVLVIVHQVLNRRWYGAIFKGKYPALRIATTVVNVLLLVSFFLTAVCGMAMSAHAVPFLYGILPISLARRLHLSLSYWSFVLMGLHLGLHLPVIAARHGLSRKWRIALGVSFALLAGLGLVFFLRSGISDYLFFQSAFAFLDYEAPAVLVFLDNVLMLLFWAFVGAAGATLCRKLGAKNREGAT